MTDELTAALDKRKARGLDAVARLRKLVGTGTYVLGGGDKNPTSPTPMTWVNGVYGCDCIGAVLWAHVIPRHLTSFPEYDGDINCDSAIMDAEKGYQGGKGSRFLFALIEPAAAYPGCLVVTPSIRRYEIEPATKGTSAGTARVRIGHVEMIAGWDGWDAEKPDAVPWDGDYAKLVTVGCSGGSPAFKMHRATYFGGGNRRTEYTTGGKSWTNPAWHTRVLEVL